MKQGAQAHLGHKTMDRQTILIPPLSEQEQIVKYLDSLSEKTQTLRHTQTQTAEDLTALEQSILHKAFEGGLVS